jgi:hypothetical protein
MNEVLAVLYYSFIHDENLFNPEYIESDLFIVFNNIM